MIFPLLCLTLLLANTTLAKGLLPGQVKHLVTFGDSYTDVVRS